jgi:hypothetical protein
MNASHRSWADDSAEVTLPGDVLALSGERRAARAANEEEEEEILPSDLLEDGWDDEPPAMTFFVVGGPPSVAWSKRGTVLVTHAHGVVKRFEEEVLLLGTPGSPSNETALGYRLPASLDLRPLVGRRVRLTLEEEPPSGGRCGQTLTLRTADDHVWLIARCGGAQDVAHSIGGAALRVSVSPRDDGPLVVATPGLQHIVPPGGETEMTIGASRYVVELVARDASGGAAYFIADARLWH